MRPVDLLISYDLAYLRQRELRADAARARLALAARRARRPDVRRVDPVAATPARRRAGVRPAMLAALGRLAGHRVRPIRGTDAATTP
jgi:hypothetical protein